MPYVAPHAESAKLYGDVLLGSLYVLLPVPFAAALGFKMLRMHTRSRICNRKPPMALSSLVLGHDMMSEFRCAMLWPSDVSCAFALNYCAVGLETDLLVIREAIEEQQAELTPNEGLPSAATNEFDPRHVVENPSHGLGTAVGDLAELYSGQHTESIFRLAGGVGGYPGERIERHGAEPEPEHATRS